MPHFIIDRCQQCTFLFVWHLVNFRFWINSSSRLQSKWISVQNISEDVPFDADWLTYTCVNINGCHSLLFFLFLSMSSRLCRFACWTQCSNCCVQFINCPILDSLSHWYIQSNETAIQPSPSTVEHLCWLTHRLLAVAYPSGRTNHLLDVCLPSICSVKRHKKPHRRTEVVDTPSRRQSLRLTSVLKQTKPRPIIRETCKRASRS